MNGLFSEARALGQALPGTYGGLGDAVRHSTAAGMLTQGMESLGLTPFGMEPWVASNYLGYLNEVLGMGRRMMKGYDVIDAEDMAMDFLNNYIGSQLGRDADTSGEVIKRVFENLEKLQINKAEEKARD